MRKYCSCCGGAVNRENGYCSKCNKKYMVFSKGKFILFGMISLLLTSLIIMVLLGDTVQVNVEYWRDKCAEVTREYETYVDKAEFVDGFVVFIDLDTNKVHKYNCPNRRGVALDVELIDHSVDYYCDVCAEMKTSDEVENDFKGVY